MSLDTGRLINRNNYTPLPIPSEFIDYVHRTTHRTPVGLAFADINNLAFPEISDDDEVVDVSDFDSENSDNDDYHSEAADSETADPEDCV